MTERHTRRATAGAHPGSRSGIEDLRKATAAVQAHPWWERCEQEGIKGADLVATRMALKHADGAVPLRQEDVDATA